MPLQACRKPGHHLPKLTSFELNGSMRTQFTLLLLLLIPLAGLQAAEPANPNIVVFLADDMGWGDSAKQRNCLPGASHSAQANAEARLFVSMKRFASLPKVIAEGDLRLSVQSCSVGSRTPTSI